MKFRHHRGSLVESLQTLVDVQNLAELRQHLEQDRDDPKWTVGKLASRYYCYDARLKWDTWLVTEDGNAIGFSDGELK